MLLRAKTKTLFQGKPLSENQQKNSKEEIYMSNIKRVLSLMIVFIMTAMLMIPAVSAFSLPEDVAGTKYEEAVALLTFLPFINAVPELLSPS